MWRWVYAVRGLRSMLLVASTGLSSCISQLSDLRPGGDAGEPRTGRVDEYPVGSTLNENWPATEDMVTDDDGSSSSGRIAPSTQQTATEGVDLANSESTSGTSTAAEDAGAAPPMAPIADRTSVQSSEDCPVGSAMAGGHDAGGCAACPAGGYCAGGETAFTACDEDAWDHDADAATACAPKGTCDAGQFVVEGGDALSDRVCAPCADGEYSDGENAAACQRWSTCAAPDSYEVAPPTAEVDRICAPCPRFTVSFDDNSNGCGALVYQMAGGQVAIEAEHPHVITNRDEDVWSEVNLGGVSGGKCLEIGPDDESDWTSDPFATAPRLDYLVSFDDAGTFYIHVRGDAGLDSTGYSDSCYAAVDGEATDWYRFEVAGGTWGWVTKSVVIDEVGVHLVSLMAREDGFRVDKLVISTSPVAPTGNGPVESPREVEMP